MNKVDIFFIIMFVKIIGIRFVISLFLLYNYTTNSNKYVLVMFIYSIVMLFSTLLFVLSSLIINICVWIIFNKGIIVSHSNKIYALLLIYNTKLMLDSAMSNSNDNKHIMNVQSIFVGSLVKVLKKMIKIKQNMSHKIGIVNDKYVKKYIGYYFYFTKYIELNIDIFIKLICSCFIFLLEKIRKLKKKTT